MFQPQILDVEAEMLDPLGLNPSRRLPPRWWIETPAAHPGPAKVGAAAARDDGRAYRQTLRSRS